MRAYTTDRLAGGRREPCGVSVGVDTCDPRRGRDSVSSDLLSRDRPGTGYGARGAAAAVRIVQGAESGSWKLGKSFARSWGAAIAEVSATGWPPSWDFRDRDAWLSTSGFSRGRTLSGSWRVV